MKVYFLGERDWMCGTAQRWMIVDENMECIPKFGFWKNRKALKREFMELNNGTYELIGEIKLDHYAKMRNIAPKKGWIIPQ